MEYAIEGTKGKTLKMIKHYMPLILKELKLENSSKALLIKVSSDDLPEDFEGGALYIDVADCYVILLTKNKRTTLDKLAAQLTCLCHEMIHIKQMCSGLLRRDEMGVPIWRGKKYDKAIKYTDMPWEIAALSGQELLVQRVLGN